MSALKKVTGYPLIEGPREDTMGWMKVNSRDRELMLGWLKEVREGVNEFTLSITHLHLSSAGMGEQLTEADRKRMKNALPKIMETPQAFIVIPEMLSNLVKMGVVTSPTEEQKELVRGELSVARLDEKTGVTLAKAHHHLKTIGEKAEITEKDRKTMARNLRAARRGGDGMFIGYMLYYMLDIGLDARPTPKDWEAIQKSLQHARKQSNGREILELHYLIRQLPKTEEATTTPAMPPLKEFRK